MSKKSSFGCISTTCLSLGETLSLDASMLLLLWSCGLVHVLADVAGRCLFQGGQNTSWLVIHQIKWTRLLGFQYLGKNAKHLFWSLTALLGFLAGFRPSLSRHIKRPYIFLACFSLVSFVVGQLNFNLWLPGAAPRHSTDTGWYGRRRPTLNESGKGRCNMM